MAMTTRRGKGAKLTWDEGDGNFERVGVQSNERNSFVLSPTFVKGNIKVLFTNNSSSIVGQNFNDPDFLSLESLGTLFVVVDNIAYQVNISSVEDESNATFVSIYYGYELDPQTPLYNTWPFATGQYDVFASITHLTETENENIVLSKNTLVEGKQNVVSGFVNNIKGEYNYVSGRFNNIEGNEISIIGSRSNAVFEAGNGYSQIIGFESQIVAPTSGNNSMVIANQSTILAEGQANSIVAGYANSITGQVSNSAILASLSTTLGGVLSQINHVIVIGFNEAQLDFLVLSNCVVVPRLLVYEIPVFESDAAAGAGGLIAGMAYRNAVGQAFYKLP